MKRVLITGANSYIGENVRDYLLTEPDRYSVDIKDTIGWDPSPEDFTNYDTVFNVAGIAHIKETKENKHLYYEINRDLVIKIATAAKKGGVKKFILLSTMSVYGLTTGHITKNSRPHPVNAYGESKLQADREIEKLSDDTFRVVCLRPPMVYGKGCKGNYQSLRNFVLKMPLFPNYNNKRSMIYIGNLCEFVKCSIDEDVSGIFFPQNAEYVNTSEMVRLIANCHNHPIRMTRLFNPVIKKVWFNTVKKVFGNLTYELSEPVSKYSFSESIEMSERK